MMALRQNPNAYAFTLPMDGPSGRRGLSGASVAAIGFTIAVHLAVGAYLYTMHVALPVISEPIEPVMIMERVHLPPPPPPTPVMQTPRRPIQIHQPLMVDQT